MAGIGAAALKKEVLGWELIPARQFAEFGFHPSLIEATGKNIAIQAIDEQGRPSKEQVVTRWSRGLLYVISGKGNVFKYLLHPSKGEPPKPVECATHLALQGETITATLPAGVQTQADKIRWVIHGAELEASAKINGRTLTIGVPSTAAPGEHAWLQIPNIKEDLWLDFVTAAPYELEITPTVDYVRKGEAVPLQVTLSSNVPKATILSLKIAASVGKIKTPKITISIPGQTKRIVTTEIALPWEQTELELTAAAWKSKAIARMTKKLNTRIEQTILTDLTSDSVTWEKGYCQRGKNEIIGGDTMYEGDFKLQTSSSGGVKKMAIFSHPPWGASGPGYIFGTTTIDLPKDPALLQWYMGKSDRVNPSDGVIYRVVVLDADGPHQIFQRDYGQVKWTAAEADLSAFAGRKITLKLIVDCGPNNDTTADHSNWGEPRIVTKQECMHINTH